MTTKPKMMPGQTQYSAAELAALRTMNVTIHKAEEVFELDELEASAVGGGSRDA